MSYSWLINTPYGEQKIIPQQWKHCHNQSIYSYFEKGCRKRCTRQSPWYFGWFWVYCSSKKFWENGTREAMDVCLRILKESNRSRFDSYSVRISVLIISHITFRDCRVHIFSDNLSRNSCIPIVLSVSLNFMQCPEQLPGKLAERNFLSVITKIKNKFLFS